MFGAIPSSANSIIIFSVFISSLNLSIIIPTLNEAQFIGRLLDFLLTESYNNAAKEIIVVDGGSTDKTVKIAQKYEVKVLQAEASRAKQMNAGVAAARFDYLYFIHADTLPPANFYTHLIKAQANGFSAACFRSRYDHQRGMMCLNSFFTRFKWLVSRGGDQSLFISKEKFLELGGFDENMAIMEEYPLFDQLIQQKTLCIMPAAITISTRKYDQNSWFQVQRANYRAYKMYKNGADSRKIKEMYESMLH